MKTRNVGGDVETRTDPSTFLSPLTSTNIRLMPSSDKRQVLNGTLLTADMIEITRIQPPPIIQQNPFTTLRDIQTSIRDSFQVTPSIELIRLTVKHIGFSRKRAKVFSEAKHMHNRTIQFLNTRSLLLNHRFVSIDETSFGRNFIPLIRYELIGKRLRVKKPMPRITTQSVLAAISNTGDLWYSQKAGSFNASSFLDFLKTIHLPPKTVLIMDNVAFHKSKGVLEYLQKIDCIPLFIPPYSPDYNQPY